MPSPPHFMSSLVLFCFVTRPVSAAYWNFDGYCWPDLVQVTPKVQEVDDSNGRVVSGRQHFISLPPPSHPTPSSTMFPEL